mgnify:CR=1 FL=1
MIQAVQKVTASFNRLVYTPQTEDGKALPKPEVQAVHTDHESSLTTKAFQAFCGEKGIDASKSPPYDHDLNPIAERVNRTIPEIATASFLLLANASSISGCADMMSGAEYRPLTPGVGSSHGMLCGTQANQCDV